MMNITVPPPSDEDILAIVSSDDWSFDVFVETGNYIGPDVNIYSLDGYESLDDDRLKYGALIINERYLNALFKKEHGMHVQDYIDSKIIISDTDWWPEQNLNEHVRELIKDIAWRALGKAMRLAEDWSANKWMEAAYEEYRSNHPNDDENYFE